MQPLLITMGDPTGIGPELIIKSLLNGSFEQIIRPIHIVGDVDVLCHAGKIFDCKGRFERLDNGLYSVFFNDKKLIVHSRSKLSRTSVHYGQPDINCGRAMADYVEYAITRCLENTASGIVTPMKATSPSNRLSALNS